jgi:hypothetical protein
MPTPESPRPKHLLDPVRAACGVRHYSPRTADSYHNWVKRYILQHGKRHPASMAEPEVNAFLSHLAVDRDVAASNQNQAVAPPLFLYGTVLGRPLDQLAVVRAIRPAHVHQPGSACQLAGHREW